MLVVGLRLVLYLVVNERVSILIRFDNWWGFVNNFRLVSVIEVALGLIDGSQDLEIGLYRVHVTGV